MNSDWYSEYIAQPDDVAWFRAYGDDEAWAKYKVFVPGHKLLTYMQRASRARSLYLRLPRFHMRTYVDLQRRYPSLVYTITGRAMVERRRRRRLHREERYLGTACDVPARSCLFVLTLVSSQISLHIWIYMHTHLLAHLSFTILVPLFFTRLLYLSAVPFLPFFDFSLPRSRPPLRLRYLERRHVRHRDLQGELLHVRSLSYLFHLRCSALLRGRIVSCPREALHLRRPRLWLASAPPASTQERQKWPCAKLAHALEATARTLHVPRLAHHD